jgi:Do/DeqQ family serine protease
MFAKITSCHGGLKKQLQPSGAIANKIVLRFCSEKTSVEAKVSFMAKLTSQRNRLFTLILTSAFLLIGILPLRTASVSAYNRESPVVKAVRDVNPAVVNVSSEYEVRQQARPFGNLYMHPFFEDFFKDFFDSRIERHAKRTSLGSGVIIDGRRGLILTNAHVIAGTGTITVSLQDKREFEAQIVGADPDSDLAVLRIASDAPLPAIAMGDSSDIMIGETVIAIGNPFGFSHTVTTGVVSAVNRSVRTEERLFQDFIQIDASINPGNSGGPLLNINGELIGINTAIYAKAQGIGFAIPINNAKRIINDLIRFGEVVMAWIGVNVQDMDEDLAAYMKIPGAHGVLVQAVEDGSPAQAAGIKAGDVILAIGDRAVPSTEEYIGLVKNYAAGETIAVKMWRNGKVLQRTVLTRVFPEERALELAWRRLGLKVADLNPSLRQQYGIQAQEGIVITALAPGSYLDRIGLQPGDVIRRLGDETITTVAIFKKAVVKHRQENSLVMLIQRGLHGYYITVELS